VSNRNMGLSRWLTVVRRIFLGLVLLVVLLSISLRVRTYLLTRRIHEVLAGLERVEVDKTTEAELLKAVPYLGSWLEPQGRGADLSS